MEHALTISGVGAGEGLAAVRGHQSGAEWAAAVRKIVSDSGVSGEQGRKDNELIWNFEIHVIARCRT